MKNNNLNRFTILLLNLFWFCIITFLSYRMPLYFDDYQHRNSFYDGNTIESIAQIIPSVQTYYMTWGGRIVSMFFIQLILMLPKPFFAVCNGLIYVMVANVIYNYSVTNSDNKKSDVVELGSVYVFLWFFMPDFAEVVTWITGSITYLWTNLIILSFGMLYYRDYCSTKGRITNATTYAQEQKRGVSCALTCVLYVALGFFAGLSNEAGACSLVLILALFMTYKIRTRQRIYIYQILGSVSAFAGTGILLLAPGNYVRSAVASSSESANMILAYAFRIARESFYSIMFLTIPFAVVLGLAAYRFYSEQRFKSLFKEVIFCILALVSVYVLTFASGFANRIFQLPVILLCISFVTSMEAIISEASDGKKVAIRKAISITVIVLTFMASFEVVAGTLYSSAKGSFYDRQTIYYNIYDSEGVISGNGL